MKFETVRTSFFITTFATFLGCVSALATPADWGKAFRLQAMGGIENPVLLFGFNPQPEPPPVAIQDTVLSFDGDDAVLTIAGATNPQDFQLLFGLSSPSGPAPISVPPEPVSPFGSLSFDIDAGFDTLTVILSFSTDSGGAATALPSGDPLFFNPQPEPPPLDFGAFETLGMDFAFNSLSEASVRMRIIDSTDNQLALVSFVPEPEPFALVGLGLVAAGICRRLVKSDMMTAQDETAR